jgi:TolA-binding protein
MNIKPEDRFWIGIYAFTGFIMLVAMGVFGWLVWISGHEPGVGRVAGARVQAPASSIPDERYEMLAAFRAPEYVAETPAPNGFQNADFQKAMQRYARQDFAGAIPELRAAANAMPGFIAARFYLGICLLLTGDRISGIQELRAVIEAGGTPYQERARFYLAKGLIAEHDVSRARTQLESLIAQHGELEKQATALLAQIRPSS